MERRANEVVEKVAGLSTQNTTKTAFEMEMQLGENCVYMYNYQLI